MENPMLISEAKVAATAAFAAYFAASSAYLAACLAYAIADIKGRNTADGLSLWEAGKSSNAAAAAAAEAATAAYKAYVAEKAAEDAHDGTSSDTYVSSTKSDTYAIVSMAYDKAAAAEAARRNTDAAIKAACATMDADLSIRRDQCISSAVADIASNLTAGRAARALDACKDN